MSDTQECLPGTMTGFGHHSTRIAGGVTEAVVPSIASARMRFASSRPRSSTPKAHAPEHHKAHHIGGILQVIEARAGPLIELPLAGMTPKAPVAERSSFSSFTCVSRLTVWTPHRLPPSTQTSIRPPSQTQVGVVPDRIKRVCSPCGLVGITYLISTVSLVTITRSSAASLTLSRNRSSPGRLSVAPEYPSSQKMASLAKDHPRVFT